MKKAYETHLPRQGLAVSLTAAGGLPGCVPDGPLPQPPETPDNNPEGPVGEHDGGGIHHQWAFGLVVRC
jgi:hypothetical protein